MRQLCNLIPSRLVPKLARDTGGGEKSRAFTPWSHVARLIFAKLTRAPGLNYVCDALRLRSGPLSAIRGASGPGKNGFSTANREGPAKMAQDLFWRVLEHLQNLHPGFGGRRRPKSAFRFKRAIHLVDATTIQLIARCMDWAKHRRRKAAAKCHLRDGPIRLTGPARKHYPVELPRVAALAGADGQVREMTFLANRLEWSAQTIADLYRRRPEIEAFFKRIKQTPQLADFPGNSASAVQWRIWTALPTCVLLRFGARLGQWANSFTRLFALSRPALWQKLELRSLLEVHGTAGGGGRFPGTPQQAFLAGFE